MQNTRVFREPNVMTCVRGVQNLTAMSFSQEDAPMRAFDLVTDDQWKVPTKLDGPVAGPGTFGEGGLRRRRRGGTLRRSPPLRGA